jgi:hypothetical protein
VEEDVAWRRTSRGGDIAKLQEDVARRRTLQSCKEEDVAKLQGGGHRKEEDISRRRTSRDGGHREEEDVVRRRTSRRRAISRKIYKIGDLKYSGPQVIHICRTLVHKNLGEWFYWNRTY